MLILTIRIILATCCLVHLLLTRPYKRSTVGWVLFVLGFPLIGSLVYLSIGINRIKRGLVLKRLPSKIKTLSEKNSLFKSGSYEDKLASYVSQVTKSSLFQGNKIEILDGGDIAYPAMLTEISNAKTEVLLSTYIFANDETGLEFCKTLKEASLRGVTVKILIDDVGARYSLISITEKFSELGLDFKTFMPTRWPWHLRYAQLRNHRKLLLIDGQLAFSGGMNIQKENTGQDKRTIRDICFQIKGPLVSALREVFVGDWRFSGGVINSSEMEDSKETGQAFQKETTLRVITDGPDSDFDKLRMVLIGALNIAQERVQIVTPYFLPDESLISVIKSTILRGVKVELIIPEHSNLKLVDWALKPLLPEIFDKGVDVFLSPKPFDHSKIMLVDNFWTLIGSANWDSRSLALNFEVNTEVYSKDFAVKISKCIEERKQQAIDFKDRKEYFEKLPFPIKLRNSAAALLWPYL